MNELHILADLLDRAGPQDVAPITWGELHDAVLAAAEKADAYEREVED